MSRGLKHLVDAAVMSNQIVLNTDPGPAAVRGSTIIIPHMQSADGLAGISLHCEANCEGPSGPQPSQGRASLQLLLVAMILWGGRCPHRAAFCVLVLMRTALSWNDVALQPTLPKSSVPLQCKWNQNHAVEAKRERH